MIRRLLIFLTLLVTACTSTASTTEAPQATLPAVSSATPAPTLLPAPSTETPNPTATEPPLPTETATLTPEPPAPLVSVSENTHCRTGPGTTYDSLAVFEVGQTAEVLAQSSLDGFWYITNPQNPDERCWISGLYAEVEGDTGDLDILTPEPSPTPLVGFEIYLRTFESCGSTFFVVFAVRNAGAEILKSGNVEIVEEEKGTQLYGPAFQRFPFAEQIKPVCPPGHGNILLPGEVQYIHVPIDPIPHGAVARGTVKLCTADYQGGDCVTKTIWFQIK